MTFKMNLFKYYDSFILLDGEPEKRQNGFDELEIGRGKTKEEAIERFKKNMIQNYKPKSIFLETLEIDIPEIKNKR